MTARHALALLALATLAGTAPAAEPKPFPVTPTKWQGFAKHDFKVGELEATVVVPDKPLPGRPWVWRGEFFGAFADCDVALVKAGWHLAYLKVPERLDVLEDARLRLVAGGVVLVVNRSFLSDAKKLSIAALSQQSPRRLMLHSIRSSRNRRR